MRTNRSLIGAVFTAIGVGACFGSLWTWSAAKGQAPTVPMNADVDTILRAKMLQLVDDNGKVGALLTASSLQLFGSDGKERLSVVIARDGTLFAISGPDARKPQFIVLTTDVGGQLFVSAAKGDGGVVVGTTGGIGGAVGGRIAISNPAGKEVVDIQSGKSNCGLVIVNDFNGKLVRGLSAD